MCVIMKRKEVKLFVMILCAAIVFGGCATKNIDNMTFTEWETFADILSKNGFLSEAIVDAMPDFRTEKSSQGGTLYLWSAWDETEEVFIHKIELNILKGKMEYYSYTQYFFDVPYLDSPLSMKDASDMVKRFASMFLSDNNYLTFENEPAYFSRYDEGHVESWVAEYNGTKHIIMVDLDMGNIVYYGTE